MQDMVFCFSHKSSALSCDRAGVILKVIIVLLYHSIKKIFLVEIGLMNSALTPK